MHPDLQRCFDYFPAHTISIIGSAVRNMETANDIDILFAGSEDFPAICRELGVKYCGWDTPECHVRKACIRIPEVRKPVHLLSWGEYDIRHCQLLRDGTHRHAGRYFDKRIGCVVED